MSIKTLIENKDLEALRQVLSNNPSLANAGLPYDEANPTEAHPLHRICDGVFSKKITDDEAVEIAKIFLQFGADVNGSHPAEKADTPLIAAASLHADKVAFLYLDHGADVHHAGCFGGTALHWAAWCGRVVLVERLIALQSPLNKRCIDFQATPLFWAVHGFKNGGYAEREKCVTSVKLLIRAGADRSIPNKDGTTAAELLNERDRELKELLNGKNG